MKLCRQYFYRWALAVLTLSLAFSPMKIRAHDYWLETKNFFASENSQLDLTMWVGTALVVEEERPYQQKRTVSFNLFSQNGVEDLRGKAKDEITPVARFGVGQGGNYLIGMERNPVVNILDAEKFNEYLREEHLDGISEERAARGENNKFGYERYSRYIKTLIQVGDKRDESFRREFNFKLEIVPLENPYRKKIGDTAKFKILFNRALPRNVAVFAYNRSAEKIHVQQMQTDKNGSVRFTLDRPGFWLVRLVKMERCQTDCDETDWESYWASLSFAVR